MPFAVTRSCKLTLALIALFVVADVVWLPLSPLHFDWSSARGLIKAGLAIVACAALLAVIDWRLEGDDSRVAGYLRWAARTVGRLAPILGVMALLTSSVALLSYVAASTNLPLQDARFAAWDQALGFSWTGWLAWTNSHPWLAKTLSAAYHTSFAQIMLLLGILTVLDRDQDLWDFTALFAVTSVGVILISIAVPAAGATAFHAPDPSLLSSIHPLSGRWHLQEFLGVRDGTITAISLAKLEGIVQFPSFHTVCAMITTYGLRNVPYVRWPVAVLNAVIIVSTLTEGGHYLVDVIGGAALTVGAIALVRWLGAGEVITAPVATSRPAPEPGLIWRPARESA
ncbi:MAG: phosphatase PAP2 family protein [Hyphomicrobiaceae bacterium]